MQGWLLSKLPLGKVPDRERNQNFTGAQLTCGEAKTQG